MARKTRCRTAREPRLSLARAGRCARRRGTKPARRKRTLWAARGVGAEARSSVVGGPSHAMPSFRTAKTRGVPGDPASALRADAPLRGAGHIGHEYGHSDGAGTSGRRAGARDDASGRTGQLRPYGAAGVRGRRVGVPGAPRADAAPPAWGTYRSVGGTGCCAGRDPGTWVGPRACLRTHAPVSPASPRTLRMREARTSAKPKPREPS